MKFEIFAGRDFSADFVVMSDDGVTPVVLDPNDTATFTMSTNGLDPTCVIHDTQMTIVDANNGTFNLSFTAMETAVLKQDIGFKEDKFSTLSNYLGFIDFTLVAGNRQAVIDVNVREVGICLTNP